VGEGKTAAAGFNGDSFWEGRCWGDTDSMGKGKAAGWCFDLATPALEIVAHGGIQRGGRSNR
jgi:hypothetical protein